MPRIGSSPFAFPDFRGATRRLILINLAAYFVLLIASAASSLRGPHRLARFDPILFMHGWLWQPLTYSFVHFGILGTLFELLSLWFLAGFLEGFHDAKWVTSLYAVSVLGTAAAALALYHVASTLVPFAARQCSQPALRLLWRHLRAARRHRLLYGDVQFLLFLPIGIKARYLVIIYALIPSPCSLASSACTPSRNWAERWPACFCAHGAAPRRLLHAQRELVRLRNRYYRWKRRRAARKFEVYMRSRAARSSSTARAA
jgi:membrane associated rhomboid family serine protease